MRRLAPCALLVLASLPAAFAGTGWKLDWDYPGQGATWYGGRHDLRRDFAPTAVDLASDGDDFGQGYDALFDHGQGPPAEATNAGTPHYVFRFGDRPSEGHLCWSDPDCSDGVFCNGAEWCGRYRQCRRGVPPSCDDANPCTSDDCVPRLDICRSTPLGRAPEVGRLDLRHDGWYAQLYWDAVPGAKFYNVYRGESPALAGLRCFATEVDATSLTDDGGRPPGRLFVHLVTALGCGGESSAGTNSAGIERVVPDPCP